MKALDLLDRNAQARVEGLAVDAMMHLTMTVRTDASNALRGVGATVGQPINMMRLQIWRARLGRKRRGLFACFALPRRPRENVGLHVFTTPKYRPGLPSLAAGGRTRSSVCSQTKLGQVGTDRIIVRICVGFIGLLCKLKRRQEEHDRIALGFVGSVLALDLIAIANELTDEFDVWRRAHLLEQKYVPTQILVVAQLPVSMRENLIAALPFASISEGAVWEAPVAVARGLPSAACKQKDRMRSRRCRHASLLISPVRLVDGSTSPIGFLGNKGPMHPVTMRPARVFANRFSLLTSKTA